jgi:hypothetical protein
VNQQLSDASYRWLNVPRWYLWDGGFLLIGQAKGVVPAHSHHAIQIVISLDGPFAVCDHHEIWRHGRGIVVRPDAVHSFDCNGAFGAMLFVDPESSEGVWLQTLLSHDITIVPEARLASSVSGLRTFAEQPFASMEVGALIRHCVQSLSPGESHHRAEPDSGIRRPARLIEHGGGDGLSFPQPIRPSVQTAGRSSV